MSEQNTGDIIISDIENYLAALKEINFELAYLALLTREGLKPLSRWEKPLENNELELFKEINLPAKRITREVKSGNKVYEIIFSRSRAYLKLYEDKFQNTFIDKSPESQQFEGFLFGYPPCCIEKYILKPYTPNNLDEQDQKILFHWACHDCKITPLLLGPYKNIFDLLEKV